MMLRWMMRQARATEIKLIRASKESKEIEKTKETKEIEVTEGSNR